MTPAGIQALSQLADKAIDSHLRQRSMLYLESAIAALLYTDKPEVVAGVLREQAQLLEDWG